MSLSPWCCEVLQYCNRKAAEMAASFPCRRNNVTRARLLFQYAMKILLPPNQSQQQPIIPTIVKKGAKSCNSTAWYWISYRSVYVSPKCDVGRFISYTDMLPSKIKTRSDRFSPDHWIKEKVRSPPDARSSLRWTFGWCLVEILIVVWHCQRIEQKPILKMSDVNTLLIEPLTKFVKDSAYLVKKCTKPDHKGINNFVD